MVILCWVEMISLFDECGDHVLFISWNSVHFYQVLNFVLDLLGNLHLFFIVVEYNRSVHFAIILTLLIESRRIMESKEIFAQVLIRHNRRIECNL